jgi:hypothetical protein
MGEEVRKQAEKANKDMERLSTAMKWSTAAMVGGTAILGTLGLIGKEAIEAQDEILDLRSILAGKGMAPLEIANSMALIEQQIDSIRLTYGKTREEIYRTTSELVADLGAKTTSAILIPMTKLAVATKAEIALAGDLMKKAMTTYGATWGDAMTEAEKGERIATAFINARNVLGIGMEGLNTEFRQALPAAHALGIDLNELLGILGTLDDAWPERSAGATIAAMALGLTKMIGDTSRGTERFEKFGKLAKLQLTDQSGKMLPMLNVMDQLIAVFGEGALNATELAYVERILGNDFAKAASMIMEQSNAIKANIPKLDNQKLAADALAEKMKSLNIQWGIMREKLKKMAAEIGMNLLPILKKIYGIIQPILDLAIRFMKAHPDITAWATFGVAASGALLLVGGTIGNLLFGLLRLRIVMQTFAVGAQIAAAAQWLWNAAMYANPIVWIIGGIIALGAGIYLLVKHWNTVKAAMISVWEWFKKLPDLVLYLAGPLGWIALLVKHWDAVKAAGVAAWKFIKDAVIDAYAFIKPIIDIIVGAVSMIGGILGVGNKEIKSGAGVMGRQVAAQLQYASPGVIPGENLVQPIAAGPAQSFSSDYSSHRTSITLVQKQGESYEALLKRAYVAQRVDEDRRRHGGLY